jgi:porin
MTYINLIVKRVIASGMSLGVATVVAPALHAENGASDLLSPNAVESQLTADREDKPHLLGIDAQDGFDEWKDGVKKRTGLDFGLDYNTLGFTAIDSPGKTSAASGAVRVFGTWELYRRGEENNGSIVFKVENRHAYTDVAPSAFGSELGYVGLPSSVFSDQGWRTTHLFWQQRFANGRGISYLGFLDTTDYVDVFSLASPWSGFANIAFQNGSGAIGGIPDGALGAMIGGFVTEHVYLVGGLADANADPTDLGDGVDSLLNDFETFKSLELGWANDREEVFLGNAHVTFWQVDERRGADVPDGWGVSFSAVSTIDEWMPFVRGGWAEDGGSLYEASVSAGFGYTPYPGQAQLGLGVNWNRPAKPASIGDRLRDQYSLELFQQLQVTQGIEVTPNLQVIRNPALEPSDDWSVVFGLRVRAAL